MTDSARKTSWIQNLIWLAALGIGILATYYVFATRTAPAVNWATQWLSMKTAMWTVAGIVAAVGLVVPTLFTWRIVGNLRGRHLDPHPRAIFTASAAFLNTALLLGSLFIGRLGPVEMFHARGLWLPGQLFGAESFMVSKAGDWTGWPTHIAPDVTEDEVPASTPAADESLTSDTGEAPLDGPTNTGEEESEPSTEPEAVRTERGAVESRLATDAGELTLMLKDDSRKSGGDGAACLADAQEFLAKRDPAGAAIVEAAGEEPGIAVWLDCKDPIFRLPTAVHETVHVIDFQASSVDEVAYHLSVDEALRAPRTKMFPRSEIKKYLSSSSGASYQETYLTGTTGEQDFSSILAELNAYTHGLETYGKLAYYIPPDRRVSGRDGVATQMQYLALYVRHAKAEHPEQYLALADDAATLDTVQTLWTRAEEALASTRPDQRLGIEDDKILARVYMRENLDPLLALYERAGRSFTYDRALAR